jgi:hypothetical protein
MAVFKAEMNLVIEQNLSHEGSSHSAAAEIFIFIHKFHQRIHESPRLCSAMNQMTAVHSLSLCVCNIRLTSSSLKLVLIAPKWKQASSPSYSQKPTSPLKAGTGTARENSAQ